MKRFWAFSNVPEFKLNRGTVFQMRPRESVAYGYQILALDILVTAVSDFCAKMSRTCAFATQLLVKPLGFWHY